MGIPPAPDAPPFQWEPWGTIGRRSNNCYAYAMHCFEFYRPQKSTPGDETKLTNFQLPSYSNKNGLTQRLLMDNPGKVFKCRSDSQCPRGFYKIMMFIARRGNTFDDFHFYKQHNDVYYKVKKGETREKIAKFFKVPQSRVTGEMKTGKIVHVRANVWSHKQGWGTGPLLVDASGKLITDPRCADRKYGDLNYHEYCGSFCVKNSGIQVGKTYT